MFNLFSTLYIYHRFLHSFMLKMALFCLDWHQGSSAGWELTNPGIIKAMLRGELELSMKDPARVMKPPKMLQFKLSIYMYM